MVTSQLVQLAQHDEIYDLHAFSVMPNHVHLLLTPNIPFQRIARLIKGSTARWANQILGTTGKVFWQDESYDHRVRERDISRYIELNPVRAGLAATPESFPYSSASPDWRQRPIRQERG